MSDDKDLDRQIIKYMVKTMGKSHSVCTAIYNSKTREAKDVARKKHLWHKVRSLSAKVKELETKLAEVTMCSKNVSLNDLMFTLLSFDRTVREKNKEASEYGIN